MAYILAPHFAQAYQAAECNPFGACASSSRPTYGYHAAHNPLDQLRPSPFGSFFSQIENLVSEIDRESQRQAQIEAQREAQRETQREAQREAQRAAQIQAQREAYGAHIEVQRAAFRERQAQIEAHVAAQREAHRQRQLRKRALRVQFAVSQNEQGWQVDAEVPGFQQENISIEVTGENTLKIAGNTEWGAHAQAETQSAAEATAAVDEPTEGGTERPTEKTSEEPVDEKMEGITLEPSVEIATETSDIKPIRPATPDSDTLSHRSYQATVEDDFEDLGLEASMLFSTPSTPATPSEPKGKEKASAPADTVEDPEVSVPIATAVVQQSQPEVPAQQQKQEVEKQQPRNSFERTYTFPERIDADGTCASFKNGVLSITVPRAHTPQIKRIAIL